MKIENNENVEMCSKCNGHCCKNYAGSYIPADFDQEITYDFLKGLLETGKYSIDQFDDDRPLRFIRPRHKDDAPIVDLTYGGECIHFTSGKGCSLPFEKRPYACKDLIPNYHGFNQINCSGGFDKLESGRSWDDYSDIL